MRKTLIIFASFFMFACGYSVTSDADKTAKRVTCWDDNGKPFIDVTGTQLDWKVREEASFVDMSGVAIELHEVAGKICAVAPFVPAPAAKPAPSPALTTIPDAGPPPTPSTKSK